MEAWMCSSLSSPRALWCNSSDEDISPMYTTESPPSVLQGPITRARARQLNQQVNSFLSSSTYTDKDGTLERIRKGLDTSKESERNKEDVQVKLEAQSKSSSSLPRPAGPFDTKTETQDAYGLRFRRSTYAWKDKNISFPMPLVSGLLEFGVDGKSLWKVTDRICPGCCAPSRGPLGHVSCEKSFAFTSRSPWASLRSIKP
ncbi:hypothetical protein U9M48_039574 [Paspalum notatum var. saurae]|uniref:Uncharacterized protein n=1 Tax=Paspalum notatum var. saurae TaxID=547442 RepID=A0AAQ3ULL4_PASNO